MTTAGWSGFAAGFLTCLMPAPLSARAGSSGATALPAGAAGE
jgi:hypothetical protein